jgi:phage repressor protein C with HTH and peptisase S24 domain
MSVLTYNRQFKDRFISVIQQLGGLKKCSEIAEVSDETIAKWRDGKAKPQFFSICSLAEKADVSIEWLLSGEGAQSKSPTIQEGHVGIPRYDVQLSAGDGNWNEDSLKPLDYIPFTKEFLKKKLDRKSTTDLLILEASGDSMLPTIAEGDLVLVDQRMKIRTDGVYAFIQDGLARVKRFRFMAGGKVQIVSDNREIYPPETLSNEEAEYLHIIGRVRWIGHTV